MMFGAAPQHHRRGTPLRRHFVDRQYRAIRDVAGDARRSVAQKLSAHARPQAVAADQRCAFVRLAILGCHDDGTAIIAIGDDFLQWPKRDARRAAARVQQHMMQVHAVNDAVRILVAFAKRRAANGDARQLRARRAVAHDQEFGEESERRDFVFDPQSPEDLKRVRADLDAGADLAELGRLLEHDRAVALPG